MREHWILDPAITYLNHGSFGATPRVVLDAQTALREQLEREPVRFLIRELPPLLDAAREEVAAFVGADFEGLAFVPNATAGVNAVLRSLDLDRFDELLVTSHEYNASRNVLDFVAQMSDAKVVVAEIPFPIESPEVVVERVLEKVTDRTRLLLIDHITSQTGILFPIEPIIAALRERGIDTLVDGAHAPGFLPLDVRATGAAYYTGNLHKWVCAPKGAAFLWVRPNRRASIRPAMLSHGANSTRRDRSRYLLEFDFTGTSDPTAWLCVPHALRTVASLVPGGWPEVRERNRTLALRGRDHLCRELGIAPPAPDEMLGAMAAIPLPDATEPPHPLTETDPLQDALLFEHQIEVPIMLFPRAPQRLLRISAQLYNTIDEYERLAAALLLHLHRT
jgi:isopenicillin-N epimerase